VHEWTKCAWILSTAQSNIKNVSITVKHHQHEEPAAPLEVANARMQEEKRRIRTDERQDKASAESATGQTMDLNRGQAKPSKCRGIGGFQSEA